tara:strand:+ start:3985 stop:4386 length:402 start_codon:yes stop_codon:yes gene_type:complete
MKRPNTLIIEDNSFLLKVLKNLLLYRTGKLKFAKTLDEAKQILKEESFELVLSDFHLGQENSMPILQSLNESNPKQMLVFMSSDQNSFKKVREKFSKNKFWAFVNKNDSDWLIQIESAIRNLKTIMESKNKSA